uniref:Mannose-specific lectin 1 n=1 Tax=Anthurium amnicola TaxID=1678845 RepID=A0A1D1Y7K4_9ARAE
MAAKGCFHLLLLLQAILLLLDLLPTPSTAEQVIVSPGKLRSGEYLSVGEYKFAMQEDCKLVVYDGDKAVWTLNSTTATGSGCAAVLKGDDRLRVHDPWCTQFWASNVESRPVDYALVLQPNGEAVIYNKPVWATDTNASKIYNNLSPQVMIPPSKLYPGEKLSVGTYDFTMERDCSLSLVDQGRRIWSSGTSNEGKCCYAAFDNDGHLRIHDLRNNKIWENPKLAVPARSALVLQGSGQVALLAGPIWTTTTVHHDKINMVTDPRIN